MVRAGISLFGGGPQEVPDPRLRAVATLTARFSTSAACGPAIASATGPPSRPKSPMRVAVVAAGYADGISAPHGQGLCLGRRRARPLLTVNMDLLVIDIGRAPLAVGDPVELLGPNALLDDLATAAGTVAHEVLTRSAASRTGLSGRRVGRPQRSAQFAAQAVANPRAAHSTTTISSITAKA
jgi:alanine racemase